MLERASIDLEAFKVKYPSFPLARPHFSETDQLNVIERICTRGGFARPEFDYACVTSVHVTSCRMYDGLKYYGRGATRYDSTRALFNELNAKYMLMYPALLYSTKLPNYVEYIRQGRYVQRLTELCHMVGYETPVFIRVRDKETVVFNIEGTEFSMPITKGMTKNCLAWHYINYLRGVATNVLGSISPIASYSNAVNYKKMLGDYCASQKTDKPRFFITSYRDHGIVRFGGHGVICGTRIDLDRTHSSYGDAAQALCYDYFSYRPEVFKALRLRYFDEEKDVNNKKQQLQNDISVWILVFQKVAEKDVFRFLEVSKFFYKLLNSGSLWRSPHAEKLSLPNKMDYTEGLMYGGLTRPIDFVKGKFLRRKAVNLLYDIFCGLPEDWTVRVSRILSVARLDEIGVCRHGNYKVRYELKIHYADSGSDPFIADKRMSTANNYIAHRSCIPYNDLHIYNTLRSGSLPLSEAIRECVASYFTGLHGACELTYVVDPYSKYWDVYFIFADFSAKVFMEIGHEIGVGSLKVDYSYNARAVAQKQYDGYELEWSNRDILPTPHIVEFSPGVYDVRELYQAENVEKRMINEDDIPLISAKKIRYYVNYYRKNLYGLINGSRDPIGGSDFNVLHQLSDGELLSMYESAVKFDQ